MAYETFVLDMRPPLAEIRLSRPIGGNPIDDRFLAELESVTAALNDDATVHAVLLTSEGDVFSSGRPADPSAAAHQHELPFRCLELMGQPVLALVDGNAIGAGLELALACDVRFASERAMFVLPDVAMNMLPSHGGTQRLPRIVGRAKAAEMILLGARLDAQAALACGLVNAVLPAAEARARVEQAAATIAERGPIAVRYAKEAIVRGLDMPLDQALRFETDLTVILQTTADRAEGVAAFVTKRPPRFKGT